MQFHLHSAALPAGQAARLYLCTAAPADETAALLAHTGGSPFTAFIRYDHLDRCCHLLATYTHGSYRYYHQP